MIDMKVKTEDKTRDVVKAVEKAKYRNFRHAAASISKGIKESLVKSTGPSAPGAPPHTHKGAFLRRAVRYAADKEGAVIGPRASVVGLAGEAHEFGKELHGTDYPERPFVEPGLEAGAPRFAADWQGSVTN